jgi:hypothetical protein
VADPARDPAGEYHRRLDREARRLARLRGVHRAVVWGRIVELFLTLCLLYVVFAERALRPAWAWIAVALFAGSTVVIAWLEDRIAQREAIVRYYQQGLARIEERWQDGSPRGDRFADEKHPYADDLDLFGRGGLYGLLCVARTAVGEETLARWLGVPAAGGEVRARQVAVTELIGRVDLREQLWQAGGAVEDEGGQGALLAWIEGPRSRAALRQRLAVLALAAAGPPALWLLASGRVLPALGIFIVQALVSGRYRTLVARLSDTGARRARELRTVAGMVALLERERFAAPLLTTLVGELTDGGVSSRRRLRGLVRLVNLLDLRRSALMALVTAPLLLGTQAALAIEAWRERHQAVLARWVRAVGTLEALASLATYAYEHPADVFPEILEEAGPPRLSAEEMAHPLLPRATRQANDLTLGDGARMVIVTGSNMSGKTTFLRTTGINAVLALAGAPVCARRMALTPLQVGASLLTRESLQEGVSRFYGEIRRLRTIVEMAERSPRTLFLIDEMLHGTNSQDRHRGGEAVLRQLAQAGCIGLITTHDLSLARLAEQPALAAANFHFQDRIEGDRLIFDYRMRPGITSRSNALDLMRLVGLRV